MNRQHDAKEIAELEKALSILTDTIFRLYDVVRVACLREEKQKDDLENDIAGLQLAAGILATAIAGEESADSLGFECWGADHRTMTLGKGSAGKVVVALFCPDYAISLIIPNEMRATFASDMRELAAKVEVLA